MRGSFQGREDQYTLVGEDSALQTAGQQTETINFSHMGMGLGFKLLTSEVGGEYVTHYSTQHLACIKLRRKTGKLPEGCLIFKFYFKKRQTNTTRV